MAKVTITLDLECAAQLRKSVAELEALHRGCVESKTLHAEYIAKGDKGRQEWAELCRKAQVFKAILEALQ